MPEVRSLSFKFNNGTVVITEFSEGTAIFDYKLHRVVYAKDGIWLSAKDIIQLGKALVKFGESLQESL